MSLISFFKKLVIVVIIGSVLGAILGLALTRFDEEQLEILVPGLIAIAVVGYILFCIYVIVRYFKFSSEVNRLLKILLEDIDVEKYIAETKTAIINTKNKVYKLQLSINLAIGYEANGEYQKAIEHMTEINIKSANVRHKALYYNNLAFFYSEVGDSQKAIQIYLDGERSINKFSKNPNFSSTFLHTKAIIEYSKGNFQLSEELLEKSRFQGKLSIHGSTSVNLYLAKIYIKTDRIQKAIVLLEYNMIQKLMPNIMEESKRLLAEIK